MILRTQRHRSPVILKAGVAYFGLVFGAGFILGPVRILLIVPRFGARIAELVEMPLMLVVTVLAAKWVVHKFGVLPVVGDRLAVGLLALGLLLLLEFTFVLKLRGLTLEEYFRGLDPVSGTSYYLTLGVFGIMPLLVSRRLF